MLTESFLIRLYLPYIEWFISHHHQTEMMMTVIFQTNPFSSKETLLVRSKEHLTLMQHVKNKRN